MLNTSVFVTYLMLHQNFHEINSTRYVLRYEGNNSHKICDEQVVLISSGYQHSTNRLKQQIQTTNNIYNTFWQTGHGPKYKWSYGTPQKNSRYKRLYQWMDNWDQNRRWVISLLIASRDPPWNLNFWSILLGAWFTHHRKIGRDSQTAATGLSSTPLTVAAPVPFNSSLRRGSFTLSSKSACLFFERSNTWEMFVNVNEASDNLKGTWWRKWDMTKPFLHKLLVEGLGYVPGVCWKFCLEKSIPI